jgi:hypothetical protein
MFDERDAQQLIAALPCNVELPAEWSDFFERQGPMPTIVDDARQFPRFYYRAFAALASTGSLPALERTSTVSRVYLKDISRTSVCFIHSEQFFPCERPMIILTDGSRRDVSVVRCRRLQERC